ncbi:hypothetical protein GCM10020220_061880 [Nonomuraea rubra]
MALSFRAGHGGGSGGEVDHLVAVALLLYEEEQGAVVGERDVHLEGGQGPAVEGGDVA